MICSGGSVILGPLGEVLAGPLTEGEGILVADLDRDQIVRGKFDFDVVGHYARPDVFSPHGRRVAAITGAAGVDAAFLAPRA